MSVLAEIIAHKQIEVAQHRALVPVRQLEQSVYFTAPTVSLVQHLQRATANGASGIIAEIKRAAPSQGVLNPTICVAEVSTGYIQAGASALSVLTDEKYFQGSLEDLRTARRFNPAHPILRKDFIIDEYQLLEARAAGADVVLLIAAALSPTQIQTLARQARALGLETLLEIRQCAEVPDNLEYISALGVNNRNLSDLQIHLDTALELAAHLPPDLCKVAESGLSQAATIRRLREVGYQGFLIGTAFMRHPRPQDACAALVKQLGSQKLDASIY